MMTDDEIAQCQGFFQAIKSVGGSVIAKDGNRTDSYLVGKHEGDIGLELIGEIYRLKNLAKDIDYCDCKGKTDPEICDECIDRLTAMYRGAS